MVEKSEVSFANAYRRARKAFIQACDRAHGDSITRVHPTATGPDGKPLFIDSVAFGSRAAKKALLVITGCDGGCGLLGSRFLTALLDRQVIPLTGTRLVLIHAFNPFGFAWGRRVNEDGMILEDPAARGSWSFDMLRAIVTEDLAQVRKLRVLAVARNRRSKVEDAADQGPARALKEFKPGIDLVVARLELQPALAVFLAKRVVTRALATL
ncbi:MAG TPA: DUF2817 domain-containing protein [Rhizomicrobium sp.]|nr:DUF2817 domain-containing protein [Rhizomicrobium sp.]